MANGYKQALARFEAAVRAHAFVTAADGPAIEREYRESKQALVNKLQYRKLAAEVIS